MKIKLGSFLRIAVSVSILVLIPWFLRDKLREAFEILHHEVRLGYFFTALAVYAGSMLLLALRMHWNLQKKHVVWDYMSSLYVSFMGIFFSLFLPSAIGGDVVKGVYLSKHARTKADVFSCLVIDRLSGFCVVMFLAFLSSATLHASWNHLPDWISWTVLGSMVFAGMAIFIKPEILPFVFSKLRFLPEKLQSKLNEFYDSLSGFFHDRGFLLRSLILSVAAQSFFITAYYFIGKALDAPISFAMFFMLVPMITIISMTPSVGGAGVREAGALLLFKHYMPQDRALAMTVLIDVVIFIFSFSGGLWYFFRSVIGRDPKAELKPQNS